ncbi:MAG: HIRAN domain-containing protein [Clostridia bacterium]
MSDLTNTNTGGLVGFLHGKNGELAIPKPFEKEIFLFETNVAGTSYVVNIEKLEPLLNVEDKLNFFREPDNKFDSKAIVIKTEKGDKIGYIPREDNLIFARLMDAGKLLYGRIAYKEKRGKFIEFLIKIYLHE